MQALESLMFTIGLIDQVSRPLAGIDQNIHRMTSNARSGFMTAAVGAAGLAGAGYLLKSSLEPALEVNAKLGEVASLGVAEEALGKLNATALKFSVEYGESAADFVAASYDIQSAISGLNGTELASFTNASGVLAKATKADTGTITDYMGTMFSLFEKQAQQMGKSAWVDMVAGRTATAVQMFKTTGQKMSSAFSAIGSNATAAGIDMAEQMAILGTLQASMSGSEAGTKYNAFLAGVGKAQDKLGLKFTDSQGRMLPILQILDKLRGKFGDTLDVAESDALTTAFGSDQATLLIKNLIGKTDGLAKSMDALGDVKGIDNANRMASAMVDPFQRWAAGIQAVRIGLGQALLPVLNPLIDSLADGLGEVTRWTQMFPNLTRVVGYAVLAVIGLTAVSGLFTLAMGLGKTVMVGWQAVMLVFNGVMKLVRLTLLAGQAAVWLFNAALWASPITWIVAAILALVGVVMAAIYYWDEIKAAVMDTAAFQGLMALIDTLTQGWALFTAGIADSPVFRILKAGVESLMKPFRVLGDAIGWVMNKLGIDQGPEQTLPSAAPALGAPKQDKVAAGGINQQISSTAYNRGGNTYHVGIQTAQAPSAGQLDEYLELNAG